MTAPTLDLTPGAAGPLPGTVRVTDKDFYSTQVPIGWFVSAAVPEPRTALLLVAAPGMLVIVGRRHQNA